MARRAWQAASQYPRAFWPYLAIDFLPLDGGGRGAEQGFRLACHPPAKRLPAAAGSAHCKWGWKDYPPQHILFTSIPTFPRLIVHSGGSRNPVISSNWAPAFAGETNLFRAPLKGKGSKALRLDQPIPNRNQRQLRRVRRPQLLLDVVQMRSDGAGR